MAAAQGTELHADGDMKPNSSPEDDTPDHIGSNGSTPTGIATPQPDPADKRLPSIMHNYFQVGSFSGDKASLPRFWSYLSTPSPVDPPSPTPPSSITPPGASSESFVMMEREDGQGSDPMEVIPANPPTPPHSLLQQESDEMDLGSSLDTGAGSSMFHMLKKYLIPPASTPPSRRQTSLPVSSVSDDPVLATHFSNPSLPPAASDAFCPSDTPLVDHAMPHVSISSEKLAKLTGNAPDGVRLKNTPPLTPRAMSNEDQSAEKKSITSAPRKSQSEESPEETPRDGMDSSTDEIAMKLDEAFPRQSSASPQNGAPVGPLKGKLFVKISEARGLRPSFDPYVVCVFEWNEYISKGARSGEEEKKRRQMESDAEAGKPMAIPMKSRQSSHNSALDGHDHKGRTPVTDPHWDHEAVFDVLGDQSEVDVTVYDRSNQEAFLGHANFKGFTFVNESSIDHHLTHEPGVRMDEDTVQDDAWQRTHRANISTDQRMSGVQKTDGTEPGIFNVDDNFDM
ncbi:Serine/threonine-protein kinase SCH9 [Penicillium canariense]|uniref:Serine/threonine-protein kinase SCH9 n=1 Tax=Penicillium canariense TaxID=189055 RepID=A0A9W9LIU3_9EURO|nr:Serine/threonine-protein kinase SCH9 [Penicillium canariense]KAJ5157422.1 Serine/threonine-protein kinase SCH9 [Penicillium canariense]